MITRSLTDELAAIHQLELDVDPDPGAPEPVDAECAEHPACRPLS